MTARVRRLRRLRIAVLAAVLCAGALAALDVPFLSGRVNDLAGMVPSEVAARIDAKLAAYEAKTGAQVAVLTIPSLEGEAIEDYSVRVASTWKLGQQDKDNGVLFLVAQSDRKMRIEVGYGLEPVLTDLATGRILDQIVRAKFRDGDFGGGIEAGVDGILAVLEGSPEAASLTSASSSPPVPVSSALMVLGMYVLVVGVFSVMALFAPGAGGWFLYLFLMPFHAIFPSIAVSGLGKVTFFTWLIGYPILRTILKRAGKIAKLDLSGGRRGGGGGFFSGGGGGWSSGGGGGGGFSGGGGSFGGGGSSSSW
jgi:uncharacterized protein